MSVPFEPWIDGFDVALCCDEASFGSDTADAYEDAAEAAQDVLWQLTGQVFGIQGPTLVRPWPCNSCCPPGGGWPYSLTRRRGRCEHLQKVTLAGYPVREITEVKIDGVVVDPSEYRLDYQQDLVRMRDPVLPSRSRPWPCRQILDLEDDQPDTWSVTYLWGQDPPPLAIRAATELACELFRACDDDADECALPAGVVSLVRAGITINRAALATALASGVVGLPQTDLFLGTYGTKGARAQTLIWSPESIRYPYRPGV